MKKYTLFPLLPNPENIRFHVMPIMRYESSGDYDGDCIFVYDKLDAVEQYAVLIHELVEKILLNIQGIDDQQVTEWDTQDTKGAYDPLMYRKNEHYWRAHQFAEIVEKKIIETAGRSWEDYDKKCDEMKIKWNKSYWKRSHKK